MNRITNRRLISVFLFVLALIPSLSFAAGIPLPVSLLTDEVAGPIRIMVYDPEVKMLSQFDDSRTEQLNRLIRHLSIDISVDQNLSRTKILTDQNEVLSFLQKQENNVIQRIFSFEPAVIYTDKNETEENGGDGLADFLEEKLVIMNQNLEHFYSLFAAAPEAFSDRIRTEKTDLRFTGFGRAVKRVTITFPADYVNESFPDALTSITQSSSCKEFVSGLIFSGSQKIGILYDENEKIVRITYDGQTGKTPDALRKVSLVWKCLREDNHVKDSVSFKSPAVTGSDKDNIAMERDLDLTDNSPVNYLWDVTIDHRAGKDDRKQTHFIGKLTNNESLIVGDIEYTVKRDGESSKVRITPEIMEESTGEYKGTLEFTDYSGKIVKNKVLVHLLLQKDDHLIWPGAGLTEAESGIPLTVENAENKGEFSLEETIAGIIVRKLLSLPEEDLEYFSNEIPESMWTELIN